MSEAGGWLLVGLEEKIARRQGVPAKIPVPSKEEFEAMAEKGLQPDQLKKWVTGFLQVAPAQWRAENADLARSYDRYLSKVDLWTKAQAAFGKEDFKTAISTLKLIANLDPDDHAAKMNLGSTLASTGDHAGAVKLLESIRPTFEGEADYHSTLGQLHAAMGKRDDAIDELVLALEAKPDHQASMDMLKQLGVLVPIYENPKDASSLTYVRADALLEYMTSIWDQTAEPEPEPAPEEADPAAAPAAPAAKTENKKTPAPRDTAYYLEQAGYHAGEGRHAVALAAAERAAALVQVPHERAEAARIQALRALGRVDDAVDAAKAFTAHDPKSSIAHVELAQSLGLKGDADGAKAQVQKSLELDPGNLVALDLAFWPVGKEREDIAKVQECIPALFAFADKHGNAAGAWRSLARAKLLVNSYDEAYELYKMAIALTPDDDDLRAEYWTELGRQTKYTDIIADAQTIPDMPKRSWQLRWNEAEAYARTDKKIEARAAFSQIQGDPSLHVDVRKRAKRAAGSVG